MARVVEISTLDAPELAAYRTLRRPVEHEREGIFVAEGGHVVQRLLASPLPVLSVLASPPWLAALHVEFDARAGEFCVYVAPQPVLETIVGFALHQGVMAVGRIPAPVPLGVQLETAPRPRLVIALDGVTNPENVGVIVRTAAGLGAVAVVAGETAASPWLRRAVRNSMGTVLGFWAHRVDDLGQTLAALRRDLGFAIVAASFGGHPVWDADLARDCCIVVGHEGYGIRPAILAACDETVTIPMPAGVDSLNVGAAAAVILYEARRQQQCGGSPHAVREGHRTRSTLRG